MLPLKWQTLILPGCSIPPTRILFKNQNPARSQWLISFPVYHRLSRIKDREDRGKATMICRNFIILQGTDTKKISDHMLEDLKVLLLPQNLYVEKCDQPPATSIPLEKPLDWENTYHFRANLPSFLRAQTAHQYHTYQTIRTKLYVPYLTYSYGSQVTHFSAFQRKKCPSRNSLGSLDNL